MVKVKEQKLKEEIVSDAQNLAKPWIKQEPSDEGSKDIVKDRVEEVVVEQREEDLLREQGELRRDQARRENSGSRIEWTIISSWQIVWQHF